MLVATATADEVTEVMVEASDGACVSCVEGVNEGESDEELELERLCCCE